MQAGTETSATNKTPSTCVAQKITHVSSNLHVWRPLMLTIKVNVKSEAMQFVTIIMKGGQNKDHFYLDSLQIY